MDRNYIHPGVVVYMTDSNEWRVYVDTSCVLYTDKYKVDSPYHIPTYEEAHVLRHCTYLQNAQRYVTCDGYTFGMPSASVTKAGMKTKYSVLGLWKRQTVISQDF